MYSRSQQTIFPHDRISLTFPALTQVPTLTKPIGEKKVATPCSSQACLYLQVLRRSLLHTYVTGWKIQLRRLNSTYIAAHLNIVLPACSLRPEDSCQSAQPNPINSCPVQYVHDDRACFILVSETRKIRILHHFCSFDAGAKGTCLSIQT